MEDFHSSHGRQSLSSSTNGMDNPSSSGHHAEKKWKNYKLMIDPFIKKGQQKVYRYDGLIHGPLANVFPSPLLRDPRSKISRLWRREKADLPIPKFKFDKYYIGEVPPKQITFTNLNDNVKERFLRDLCDKFGTIEDVNIMHHPKTNKHLGLATVTFTTTRAAKVAASELNRMSVMGKIIIVQVDAGGKECERIFDCLTTGKASTPSSSGSTPYDPRYGGKRTPELPRGKDPRRLSSESARPPPELASLGYVSDSVPTPTPTPKSEHSFKFKEPDTPKSMSSEQSTAAQTGNQDPGNFSSLDERIAAMNFQSGDFGMPPVVAQGTGDAVHSEDSQHVPGFNTPSDSMTFPNMMQNPIFTSQTQQQQFNFNQGEFQDMHHGMNPMCFPPNNPGQGFPPGGANFNPQFQDQMQQNMGFANNQQQWNPQFAQPPGDFGYHGNDQNNMIGFQNQGNFNNQQFGNWNQNFQGQGMGQQFGNQMNQGFQPPPPQQQQQQQVFDKRFDDGPNQNKGNFGEFDDSRDTRDNYKNRRQKKKKNKRKSRRDDEDFDDRDDEDDWRRDDDRWRNDRRSDRRDDRRRDDRRKTDHYNRDDNRNADQYNRDDRYRNDRYKDDRRRDDKGDRRRDDRWRDERRRDDGYRESRWRDKSKDREREKSWEGTAVKVEDPVVDDDGQATPTQDEHDVEQQNIQVRNDILRESDNRKVEDGELDTSTEAATDTLDSRIAAILKKTRASTDSISEGELADSSEPEKFVPRNKYLDTDSDHAPDFSRKDKHKDRHRRETKYSEREHFQHSRESSEEKQRGSHKDQYGSYTDSDRNLLRSTFRRDRKSSPKDCTDNRTIHYRGSSSPASAGFTPNKRSPVEGSTKSESFDVCKDNSKALLDSFFAGQTSDISSRESSIKNSPTDTTDIDRIDDSSKQNLDTDGDAGVPMEVQSTASDDMSMSPISDDGQNKVQVNPEMQENQEMKNQNNLNMWNNFNTSNMNNFNNQYNQFQQQNFRMNIPPPNFPMGQGYQGFPGPFSSPSFNMGFPGGQGPGGFPINPGNFPPGFQLPGQFGPNQQQQQQPPGMEQHPHYQMMAQMGIWQPRMGGNYNPGMMPPQSFNSPPPNYYDQWRNQTPGNNWNQGGVPVSEIQNQMQNQNFFQQYQNQQQQQQWQQSPPKMDPRQATLDEAMKQLVSELKNVMKKDLCRKMVETSAFKCLENWWDDCVEKSKPSKPETEPIKSQASSRSILSSLENTTEWSKNIKPVGMSRLDIGLGLRAAMPRMPSFKVKRKPPDEDSQEEKRRQRRRSIASDQEDDSDAERDKVDVLSQTSEGSVKPSKKFTSSGSEKDEDDDDDVVDEEGDLKELLQRRKRGLEAKLAEGSDEEDIYSSAGSSEDEEEEEEEPESDEEWEETQSETSESSSSSEDDEDEDVDVETEEKDTDDGIKAKVDVSIVPDMLNGEMDAKMKTPIQVKNKAIPEEKVKTIKKTKDDKLAQKGRPDLEAFEILVEMASKARELESEGGEEETKAESSSEKTESADEEPTIRDMMLMDHSYCKMPSPPPAPPPTATSLEIEHPYSQPEKSTKLTTPKSGTEAKSTPIEADTPPEEVKPTKKRKRKKTELETIIEEQIQRAEQEKEAQVPLFHPRNYYDEWQKLYEILTNGIDLEDACFLRKTYSMLLQDNRHSWLNYCHWVSHPVTVFPETAFEKKRRKTEDEQGQHDTGCARTQGYYKITMKEKKRYINRPRTIGNEPEDEGRQGSEVISRTGPGVSREARLDHRRLLTSLSHTQADSVSDLLKFNHLKFRKKELKFSKSGIHGWGLYALETISQDEMVVEYVGQMVRQTIADMREKRYENLGIGSSYLFRIDSESIIDATKCGNFARFINHSCTPNCYAKIINVDSHKKIVIYSKRQINKGDEITYDYKFPIEEEKIPCLCNSSQCRGTLN